MIEKYNYNAYKEKNEFLSQTETIVIFTFIGFFIVCVIVCICYRRTYHNRINYLEENERTMLQQSP